MSIRSRLLAGVRIIFEMLSDLGLVVVMAFGLICIVRVALEVLVHF